MVWICGRGRVRYTGRQALEVGGLWGSSEAFVRTFFLLCEIQLHLRCVAVTFKIFYSVIYASSRHAVLFFFNLNTFAQ